VQYDPDERSESVTKLIIAAEEYEMSVGEGQTQSDYSKIETVIINCKFRLVYNQ
jgi:hypothetical protein